MGQRSCGSIEKVSKFQHKRLQLEDFTSQEEDESSLPSSFGKKHVHYPNRMPKQHQKHYTKSFASGNSNSHEYLLGVEPFDICQANSRRFSEYKHLFHQWKKDKEIKVDSIEKTEEILRPGMVLLKNYVDLNHQDDA